MENLTETQIKFNAELKLNGGRYLCKATLCTDCGELIMGTK